MIYLLLRRFEKHANVYTTKWGPTPGARMRRLRYADLLPAASLRPGTYIFSDLEVLGEAGRSVARSLWQQLAASTSACRLLNDPRKALHRFDLLATLHREGINQFRAVRAGQVPRDLRFPVFVRYEQQHTGPLTALLPNRPALEGALRYLRWRGHPLARLLVVEFCDTADAHGIYRKYAAFLVGDRVLPRHLFFSRDWMIKRGGAMDRVPMDERLDAEKNDYLYGNPHERWIRDIFQLAGTDFGRLDYGMLGDRPQVWEINTNPTITDLTPRLTQAFDAIDHPETSDEPVSFAADSALVRAWEKEQRRERARDARLQTMDRLTRVPLARPIVALAKRVLRYQ